MKKELVTELIGRLTEAEKTELLAQLKPKPKFDWRSITSIELALERNGKPSHHIKMNGGETIDEWAYRMLKEVLKAINEDWIADWNNTNQPKYYPWFSLSSGFGFSDSTFNYARTITDVGSRLCFESREKCEFTAKQFLSLYEQFLTIKQ